MITDERLHHLSFMLSFPSLAIACATGDDGMTNTSFPPVVDPTNAASDDADDDDDTAASPSDSSGPSVTSDGDDAPGTSEDDDGPGTTTQPYVDTTGGGTVVVCDGMRAPMIDGMVGPVCTQYVAHRNVCYSRDLTPECIYFYEIYCQFALESYAAMYGNTCAEVAEEFYACLSQLPCEEAIDEDPDCPQETAALQQYCE